MGEKIDMAPAATNTAGLVLFKLPVTPFRATPFPNREFSALNFSKRIFKKLSNPVFCPLKVEAFACYAFFLITQP